MATAAPTTAAAAATKDGDSSTFVTHKGHCHCNAVTFEVDTPSADIEVWDCNCSICHMKRNAHFMVPKARFRLLTGEESLTTYTFGTHVAKHKFCKVCGVQSFYSPRSNPDCWGVTIHCIEPATLGKVVVNKFDGQNWESSYADTGIAEYSKDRIDNDKEEAAAADTTTTEST